MFCSPNLRVVELWSLPELDLVRLVFSFVVLFLVLLLLVQTEGFPGSGAAKLSPEDLLLLKSYHLIYTYIAGIRPSN
jgi:hypothetical protein